MGIYPSLISPARGMWQIVINEWSQSGPGHWSHRGGEPHNGWGKSDKLLGTILGQRVTISLTKQKRDKQILIKRGKFRPSPIKARPMFNAIALWIWIKLVRLHLIARWSTWSPYRHMHPRCCNGPVLHCTALQPPDPITGKLDVRAGTQAPGSPGRPGWWAVRHPESVAAREYRR